MKFPAALALFQLLAPPARILQIFNITLRPGLESLDA
jgi:hypothetical protein